MVPPPLNDNPFDDPGFLEGLEAAGYLQRLDVSEARITARYQHALTKMKFASHSEEFLTRAGVRRVHGSTVQFFNETPVSDPFVHVLVGSLPPPRQALVTPLDCPTTGWTPIGSPDEADGTIHFTVSCPGFWPLTVVFDSNPADIPGEDRYASAGSEDDAYYGRPYRRNTGRSDSYYNGAASSYARNARSASRNRNSQAALRYGDDLDDDEDEDDDLTYRGTGAARRSSFVSASGRSTRGAAADGYGGYGSDSRSDYAGGYSGAGRSAGRTGASRSSSYIDADLGGAGRSSYGASRSNTGRSYGGY